MTDNIDPKPDTELTIAEVMCVSLARRLENVPNALQGFASPLPTAAIRLAREHMNPELVHLSASGGVNPDPTELPASTEDARLLEGITGYFTSVEAFDIATRGKLSAMFVGSAQIDRTGAMNGSVVGDWNDPTVRLPGGGGSGSLLPLLDSVFAWRTEHSPRSFPERVDFVTASGNLSFVTTPLCNMHDDNGELKVTSVHPGVAPDTVRRRTGWDVQFTSTDETPLPTTEEIETLERVDPSRTRRIEFEPDQLASLN